MQNLSFVDDVISQEKRLNSLDDLIGKGKMMPFNCTNSGSRKIMYSTQLDQRIDLYRSEVPLLQTGHEIRFGQYSSSFVASKSNCTVISKINKFSHYPDHHYYLIVYDEDNDIYDVVERVSYKHITETYGFLYDNSIIDSYKPGSKIKQGDCIIKSTSFDEYNNRKDGVNLLTTYLSCESNKEDGIIVSESAKHKLESPLLKNVRVIINDNDIPLNLYGDNSLYKIFPDIGEEIKDGVLCALRREKKEESLFLQSYDRLQNFIVSDEKFLTNGKVIDVNIYSNNQELINDSIYLSQLNYYNGEYRKYLTDIYNVVNSIIEKGGKCSYELQKMFYKASKILSGSQFINEKPFSNIIIDFMILEDNKLNEGDKISNRYGGKGVISEIRPDHLMPRIETGEHVEMILNPSGCVNRENDGQLLETSINFISSRLVEWLMERTFSFEEAYDVYIRFLKHIVPNQVEHIEEYLENLDVDDLDSFFKSVINDKGIIVSAEPISEVIGLDELSAIYNEFKFIKPYKVQVPQMSSNGEIRYINARRTLICGRQYVYRLKQHAEEKFSAVSLSSTNSKNENCRNSSDKLYKTTHTKTCIRFGDMETGNLMHLDPEVVVTTLMLYSISPHGRRQFKNLLVDDPFNIDIKLNEDCSNRSVEIINAYLLTLGLELVFDREPVVKKNAFIKCTLQNPFVPNEIKTAIVQSKYKKDPFKRVTTYTEPKLTNAFVKVKEE